MRRTGGMSALGHKQSLWASRPHSPLSHIPVLRGTYASCYRRSYAKRSSFEVT